MASRTARCSRPSSRSASAALLRATRASAGRGPQPRVLIGRDTRRSGFMLEDALAAGVASAGGLAVRVGVLPTPGIATLVRLGHADLGAVISASHNPFPDNGIKLFGKDGFKLDDADEDRVVELMRASVSCRRAPRSARASSLQDAATRYADWVVVGARRAADAAPDPRRLRERRRERRREPAVRGARRRRRSVLREPRRPQHQRAVRLDAPRRAQPGGGDGRLRARARVRRRRRPRARRRPPQGVPVDGDQIVAILARDLHARRALPGDLVVVTSMSNLGFHRAMQGLGIETAVTEVGDRYVLEEMRARGAELGGEQSGHVIALGYQTTGDGLVTAALLLAALDRAGQSAGRGGGARARASRSGSSTSAPTARASPTPARSGRSSSRRPSSSTRAARAASCCAPPAPSRSCA